jgi:hypothetical protein
LQQNVSGFEIPVNNSIRVGMVHGAGQCLDKLGGSARRLGRGTLQLIGQARPFDEFKS